MFDLHKDLDRYRGIPPYANELFGIYQPLLGWHSGMTKKWLQQPMPIGDPRVRKLLSSAIEPSPTDLDGNYAAIPLRPGIAKPKFSVHPVKDLGSEVVHQVQRRAEGFVNQNAGLLPKPGEWPDLVNEQTLEADLRAANDAHRYRYLPRFQRMSDAQARVDILRAMQYESQVAGFLLQHARDLGKLFSVTEAPPLTELLERGDPLANLIAQDKSGALSPLGFVHLHRQLFFDLGTFLGEPVEHVWLAPGTTIELMEVSTRRQLIEKSFESLSETTKRSEQSWSSKDELSTAMKDENQSSTKLGVSTSNTVNLYVYEGTATAEFGVETSRSNACETIYKNTHEQAEKVASEFKRAFKSVFRTVTEETDSRSRRHVIENKTEELLNYELRRKMRRVGVQVQALGTRLCWQVFVDNPGDDLGIAKLMHVAEPADLGQLGAPDLLPHPADARQGMQLLLPFQRFNGDNDTGNMYVEDAPMSETGHVHLGDVNDKIKLNYYGFTASPPPGFELSTVTIKSVVGGHHLDPVFFNVKPSGFDLHLKGAFFPVEGRIVAEAELTFRPTQAEISRIDAENLSRKRDTDADKISKIKQGYVETIRDRITVASKIAERPSWDLRDEERHVVYRKLIKRLMLDSWKSPNTPEQRRIDHVRSEIVRAIFDVDAMLYFVAPEWWVPRTHRSFQHLSPSPVKVKVTNAQGQEVEKEVDVTFSEPVSWGGLSETARDNYWITESSLPARFGSSLGWLLQLDGDNLRNAFLNAPWVKAVIPVRPGREQAALEWLKRIEGHGDDGWDADYVPAEGDPPEFTGKKIGEVLEIIARQLTEANGPIDNVLEADKVFEHGFDHLEAGFDASVDPGKPYSQFISVIPTDQIVAQEYEPTELFEP